VLSARMCVWVGGFVCVCACACFECICPINDVQGVNEKCADAS